MLSGNNSILKKATTAKTNTNNAQIKEKIKLAYNSALTKDIADQKGEVDKSTFEDELKTEFPGKAIDIGESANKKEWVVTIDGVTENVPIGKDIPKSSGKLGSEIFESSGTTEGKMHIGDYVNYPVYYDNVASSESFGTAKDIPADTYTGWRVLSIEGTGDGQYIRLVSAGVPLNYFHPGNYSVTSVENLTTKFFSTPINSTLTEYSFYSCGFKTAQNGMLVTSISDVMGLFNNVYTSKYGIGESATYTDDVLNQTFTNSNVAGQPKVQSITKRDLDAVFGTTTTYETDISSNDLFAIPCKEPENLEYAKTWLALAMTPSVMWGTSSEGTPIGFAYETLGVRCVVSLAPNIRFSLAEGSNSTDTLKTWNLE